MDITFSHLKTDESTVLISLCTKKYEMLSHCCPNARPPPTTLAQQWLIVSYFAGLGSSAIRNIP